jgi:large subunit ribosomal protein L1
MSKTTQENKKKKLAAEEKDTVKVKTRKAKTEITEDATSETPVEASPEVTTETAETVETETKTRTAKVRGKKYQAAKKKVDPAKYYALNDALKLVKDTSFSKFDGKIEAHVTIIGEAGTIGDIAFPHLKTAEKKIVILNDTILAEIKEGKINFDILIATPVTMSRLLPFARTLGPKGLMPNPKNGTLTDKPEEAVKKLSVAKTSLKTEKKAPIIHIVVGSVSQPTEELAENVAELIKVIKSPKIKKLALCATMGPSVKVVVEK